MKGVNIKYIMTILVTLLLGLDIWLLILIQSTEKKLEPPLVKIESSPPSKPTFGELCLTANASTQILKTCLKMLRE